MLLMCDVLILSIKFHLIGPDCDAAVNSQVGDPSPLTMLSSSLRQGERACPGERITFTCVTNGSASHAWMSNEYIGRGGIQLEFASFDSPGEIRRNTASQGGTLARLIAKVVEENETTGLLESQLDIVVISEFPNPIISCLYVDTGSSNAASFQLLGRPCC